MIRLPENTQLYIKSKELENRPISIAEYIACHIDDFFSMAPVIFANTFQRLWGLYDVPQERYKKICDYLSDSLTEALLILLRDALEIIHKFQLFLQKQEVIGHSFFFEMQEIFATLVGRCCSRLTVEKVRKAKFDIFDTMYM